jgi:hypothetical protein
MNVAITVHPFVWRAKGELTTPVSFGQQNN